MSDVYCKLWRRNALTKIVPTVKSETNAYMYLFISIYAMVHDNTVGSHSGQHIIYLHKQCNSPVSLMPLRIYVTKGYNYTING